MSLYASAKTKTPHIIYVIITVAVLNHLLFPKYIFTLDMIFPPWKDFLNTIYGAEQFFPMWISTQLPLYLSMGFLEYLLQMWLIQKIILFLILFLSGISAYRLCPSELKSAKYFAGFIYMINPFVYVRFLAGHWKILLAYAIAPFAIKAFIDLLEEQNRKRFINTLFWITLVGIFNIQILILTLGVYCILFVLKITQIRKETQLRSDLIKTTFLLGISYIFLNAYWLFPTFTAETTIINQMGREDLYIYATKPSAINTAFTTASMYGFWRGGYLYPKDILPYWHGFFAFILFLAVHGFISYYTDKRISIYVKGFGLTAVLGLILGSGVYGPFSEGFESLYNNVSFFRGFRDSHKFVALVVLVYAYLGSLGVAEFEKGFKDREKRKKILSMAIVTLALITPFIYSFTMFNGFWGQLNPVDYPEDWYEVNEYLNEDVQNFNVLFFPWHGYMDFKWIPNTQKRILNPAANFFDKPVIKGENVEVEGVYTQSTSPVQQYVQFLLEKQDDIDNFGKLVSPLNVKYVLLTKEVDYKKYFFLFNQTDLELVKETENFYVFKNAHEVSEIYEVNCVSPIRNWSELLERSRTEDITKRLYLIEGSSASVTASGCGKRAVSYEKESPVKYELKEEPSMKYLVFTQPYSKDWELGDREPVRAYGIVNAYEVDGNGSREIKYERFYQIYLPSYIVSLLTFLALIFVYLGFVRFISYS